QLERRDDEEGGRERSGHEGDSADARGERRRREPERLGVHPRGRAAATRKGDGERDADNGHDEGLRRQGRSSKREQCQPACGAEDRRRGRGREHPSGDDASEEVEADDVSRLGGQEGVRERSAAESRTRVGGPRPPRKERAPPAGAEGQRRREARAREHEQCHLSRRSPRRPGFQPSLRNCYRLVTSRRPSAVASRSRAARSSVSAPRCRRHRQFPCTRPGRFIRASLPRESTSCAGTIASRARDAIATLISPQAGSRGSRPVACCFLRDRLSNQPAAVSVSCVLVYTTAFSGWLRSACTFERGPSHAHWRTTIPGSPNASRSMYTRSVMTPRSSAMSGTSPSACSTAVNSSWPGACRQCPRCAVLCPAGIAQYATKPRKWSMRATSTSSNVRANRSIHQRKPVARCIRQAYSGLPQCWPLAFSGSGGAPATSPCSNSSGHAATSAPASET